MAFIKKRISRVQENTIDLISGSNDRHNDIGNHERGKNDAFIASGSYEGTLSIWNLNTRTCVKSIKAHYPHRLSGLVSSNDGLTLVSVGWDGKILVSLRNKLLS